MDKKARETFNDDFKNSGFFSEMLFSYVRGVIAYVYQHKTLHDVKQCVDQPEKESTDRLSNKFLENLQGRIDKGNFDYKYGVIKLVFQTFKEGIFKVCFYGTVAEILSVINLFVTSFFISWLQDDDEEDWVGFLYTIIISLTVLIALAFRHRYFHWGTTTGLNIRKAIAGAIFKKVLKFNQKSLAKASTGKIVTIVSGELQVIESGLVLAPYIIIAPISTTLAFVLIGLDFKEAAALGFITYVVIVILQALIAKCTVKWKYREGMNTDKRVKIMTDCINGIRTIKSYGWEYPYRNLVQKARNNQLKYLYKNHLVNAIGSGLFMNGGFVIAFVIFTYHYGMDREFSYSRSLSTIALLSYLSLTSIFFSYTAISNFATFAAIMFRVGEIFKMEEFDYKSAENDTSLPEGTRILLENCDLSWGFQIKKSQGNKRKQEVEELDNDVNLSNINLEARQGELVAIVGSVG